MAQIIGEDKTYTKSRASRTELKKVHKKERQMKLKGRAKN